MVRRRDDVVSLETSSIMHPTVWEASGHVAGFTDPLVDCKVSKQRYRADQLFFSQVIVETHAPEDFGAGLTILPQATIIGYVAVLESERTKEELAEKAELVKRKT